MSIDYEKEVVKVCPNADYVCMGFGGFKLHSIYKTKDNWDKKNLIGQSTEGKKQAWQSAYETLKNQNKII